MTGEYTVYRQYERVKEALEFMEKGMFTVTDLVKNSSFGIASAHRLVNVLLQERVIKIDHYKSLDTRRDKKTRIFRKI